MNFLFKTILFCFLIVSFSNLSAQCDDCISVVPNNLPEDTIYLATIPDGEYNAYYNETVSFRLPKTTTPVNDPDTPNGILIESISIISLSNLPPGISWTADDDLYIPEDETDGCIQLCGTPLQTGLFLIDVLLDAQVSIFSQTTSLQLEMYIAPSMSSNDGFTMTNNFGCGTLEVSFENNIPSNGNDDISYSWDFGNGNLSSSETPVNQTYTEPGTYVVDYEAVIDTMGFILTNIQITSTDCSDIPIPFVNNGDPDLYIQILNPDGSLLYESIVYDEVVPPVSFSTNILLEEGENYTLHVKDEDSGLGGEDDLCGTININSLTNGSLSDGPLNVSVSVIHPITILQSSDTITLFPEAESPVITEMTSPELCYGDTTILQSSIDTNIQWFKDSLAILGENMSTLQVSEAGSYSIQHTTQDGCLAMSEFVEINFISSPQEPLFSNAGNLLSLFNIGALPPNYLLQWYQDDILLVGENGTFYCATESSNYSLELIDLETNCSSIYTAFIPINPNFDCTVSTQNLKNVFNLLFFPNPVNDYLTLSFNLEERTEIVLQINDLLGKNHFTEQYIAISGKQQKNLNFSLLPSGIYLLQINIGEMILVEKIVKR